MLQRKFSRFTEKIIGKRIRSNIVEERPDVTRKGDVLTIQQTYLDENGNTILFRVNIRVAEDGLITGMNNLYAKILRAEDPSAGYRSCQTTIKMYQKVYTVLKPYLEEAEQM